MRQKRKERREDKASKHNLHLMFLIEVSKAYFPYQGYDPFVVSQ